MYMYVITNKLNLQFIPNWNHSLCQFDSDVISHTPAFCDGGYILMNQSLFVFMGGIAFSLHSRTFPVYMYNVYLHLVILL